MILLAMGPVPTPPAYISSGDQAGGAMFIGLMIGILIGMFLVLLLQAIIKPGPPPPPPKRGGGGGRPPRPRPPAPPSGGLGTEVESWLQTISPAEWLRPKRKEHQEMKS